MAEVLVRAVLPEGRSDVNHRFLGVASVLTIVSIGAVSLRLAAAEPMRIVPQLAWAGVGVASPDGSLLVAFAGFNAHAVRLVNGQGDLLWNLALVGPHDAAFSPDGKWLAACGDEEGVLLDLKSCNLRRLPDFRGRLVAFTPEGQRVLIVRREPHSRWGAAELPEDEGLFIYDLEAGPLGHFPVAMDVPHRLEVLPDGKTVRVIGAHGDPWSRVPMMGRAEETIQLETGKIDRDWAPKTRGWIGPRGDSRFVTLPPVDSKRTFEQRPKGLFWEETSALCLQYGDGVPEGRLFTAWDIRQGRCLQSGGTNQDVTDFCGFLGLDTILLTTRSGQEMRIARMNVGTGQIVATPVVGSFCSPAPAGESFVVVAHTGKRAAIRLKLYRASDHEPIYTEEVEHLHASTFAWSHDGRYLACGHAQNGKPAVRVVSVADGNFEEISLADTVGRPIPQTDPSASHASEFGRDDSGMDAVGELPPEMNASTIRVCGLELGDSGKWLAVGMGATDAGLVVIANRETRQVETVLDGFSTSVDTLRFVGPNLLLTGTGRGRVQLWDLCQRKPLWTAETNRELSQLEYGPGSPYVVCGHRFPSGTVLRLKDGKVVSQTTPVGDGDRWVPSTGTVLPLIGPSTWGLEMARESMQVRLVDVTTGGAALTFCTLPDRQWIIYTTDGDWDGSERVHDWVKFCSGLQILSPTEAERRHRRESIDAVLKQVFP